jgi:hypothetical protein
MIAVVFLLLDLGLGPAALRGQDLAAAAAKEKERRAGKSGRVITEEDLAKARRGAPAAESGDESASTEGSSATASSSTAAGKSDSDQRAEREKAWRDRRDQAEKQVTDLTERIQQLEQATGDRRVYQYGPNRARQLQELQEARDQLALAQQKLADIDEEGRQEGF